MALPEFGTILYTTSLGKHTRPVFRHAVSLAKACNAKIIMLHVVQPIGEMGSALIKSYVPADVIEQMHTEGISNIKKQMVERIEQFYKDELNDLNEPISLEIQYKVMEGNHTDCILNASKSEDVNLIVMGQENSFGHHSPTTQYVVRNSTVPIVVVPTGKKYL